MKIKFDKIASTTKNVEIGVEAILTPTIPAEEGAVIAVRVHGTKTVYNQVENTSGRMVRLDDGDILAGVLGSRRALRGYAGEVPERVEVGDRLDILSLGGVIGRCTSINLELGPPLGAEILGAVLTYPFLGERTGVPASIKTNSIDCTGRLQLRVPVVYVSGTCMRAGKTYACGEIIRYLTKQGLRVCGAKLTGVSLLRDTLSMQDRGAVECLSFTDAGVVSTNHNVAVRVANGIFNALNRFEPDCIVAELGDGILGEYGVGDILADPDLMPENAVHVLCASDPVAAWGAVELFEKRFQRRILVVSGPATDNQVGKDFIEVQMGVHAANARLEPEQLGELVAGAIGRE